MATRAPRAEAEREIERVVFFSDAVFAIALTLLAIDLRLPEGARVVDADSFLSALAEVAPSLYSFALSFFVIILLWLGHYRMFRLVTEIDGLTLAANVLLLFFVVLLPFPTSILGAHADVAAAVAFYGICVGVTGLLSTALWVVVAQVRHHIQPLPPRMIRLITIRAALVPVVVLAVTPLAFVDTRIPLIAWALVWPAQLVFERRYRLHLDARPTTSTVAASFAAPDQPAVEPPAHGADGGRS
jgi:TMEM175 potassium channel family protein